MGALSRRMLMATILHGRIASSHVIGNFGDGRSVGRVFFCAWLFGDVVAWAIRRLNLCTWVSLSHHHMRRHILCRIAVIIIIIIITIIIIKPA